MESQPVQYESPPQPSAVPQVDNIELPRKEGTVGDRTTCATAGVVVTGMLPKDERGANVEAGLEYVPEANGQYNGIALPPVRH